MTNAKELTRLTMEEEAELLQRAANGDKEAGERIRIQYWPNPVFLQVRDNEKGIEAEYYLDYPLLDVVLYLSFDAHLFPLPCIISMRRKHFPTSPIG